MDMKQKMCRYKDGLLNVSTNKTASRKKRLQLFMSHDRCGRHLHHKWQHRKTASDVNWKYSVIIKLLLLNWLGFMLSLGKRFHVAVRRSLFSVTSKCGKNKNVAHESLIRRVCQWCSYHILTSSLIYYWTDARQHGISRLYQIKKKQNEMLMTSSMRLSSSWSWVGTKSKCENNLTYCMHVNKNDVHILYWRSFLAACSWVWKHTYRISLYL